MTRAEHRLNDLVLRILLRQEDAGQCPRPESAPDREPEAELWDGTS